MNDNVGYGVFATRRIPAGTITWARDPLDRRFSPADAADLPPAFRVLLDTYAHRDRHGDYVLCWDHGRFVNHDSSPACLMTAYECEIAIRDIEAGDELTDDYGCLNLDAPFTCATPHGGRSIIRPDDLVRHHAEWDALVGAALARYADVEQPLAAVLSEAARRELEAVAAGTAPMKSVLTCFWRAILTP